MRSSCVPRYVDVLTFRNCEYIIVNGLVLGHYPDMGSCMGSVVRFENCDCASIYDSELFGCGTYGVELQEASEVEVIDCLIDSCSYGMVESYDSDAIFDNVSFCDCEDGFSMFELIGSNIKFTGCDFSNLYNNMLSLDEISKVTFAGCDFDDDCYASVMEWDGSDQVVFEETEE